MRKKMKLFIAMVSVGALLGTMPVMAAEQPELPTKVQDIANGSDELYGEGVPIEHGTNPDERFSSGGVDHTHQYIVANALKILSNDKGNSAFNGELNSSILMEATDWPDKLGNETDAGTFAGHFYDPDTGKVDIDKVEGRTSKSERDKINIIIDVIKELSDEYEGSAPKNIVYAELADKYNVGEEKVDEVINMLKSKGVIYEPTSDHYKVA